MSESIYKKERLEEHPFFDSVPLDMYANNIFFNKKSSFQ